jgi:hypothetical protein
LSTRLSCSSTFSVESRALEVSTTLPELQLTLNVSLSY